MRIILKGLQHHYDEQEQLLEIAPEDNVPGPIFSKELREYLAKKYGERTAAVSLDAAADELFNSINMAVLKSRIL